MKDAVAEALAIWDFTVPGVIWKILPGPGRTIVGEERDPVNKTVSLFCVSLDDGAVRWKGLRLGQSWWTGIETVHRGIIIVHEYPVPSTPDHRNIVAIDSGDGRQLWENRDLSFAFASGSVVCGSRDLFERKAFFEIDLATGAVVRELTPGEAVELRDSADPGWDMDIGIPLPDAAVGERVRLAFPAGTGLLPGETLMHGEIGISNCYETRPGGERGRELREHLLAFRAGEGAPFHRDVICDGLAVPAGTTFFRAGERVLYVRNRATLRSFAVAPGEKG